MMQPGHNAYQASAIETASPEQLTLMCYDGALKFMRRAVLGLEANDLAKLSENTGRAQAIINELNITLNMEAGGEIARNLRDIYLFVNRHMSQGAMKRDAQHLTEAMELIQGLRDSWAQAMNLGAAAA
ncbi:MAG: flagellar export chaperone FliS [Thermoleophilia bacterium]|nr:flagellar export chaperone FliS [Thermoleophilia bacterium]